MIRKRFSVSHVAVSMVVLGVSLVAAAQEGKDPLFAPGDPVPAEFLLAEGGPAGRDLAKFVGKRPVLAVYWRPGDPDSEQVLSKAAEVAGAVAAEAVFFPIAALARAQSPGNIPERLASLNLKHLSTREDTGQLALAIGIRSVPSFVLIDAGGVLRLVGGSDITQNSKQGLSIAEALALAGKGAAVPTLGVIPSQPVYRKLWQKLPPELTVTELDGATYRRLSEYVGGGKKTLLFYWMPTCPHCLKVLPQLRGWYEAKHSEHLNVVDISRGDAPVMRSESVKVIKDYPWKHVLDIDRSVGATLAVRETPAVFLVSETGEIVGIRTGEGIDWSKWLDTTLAAPTPVSASAPTPASK